MTSLNTMGPQPAGNVYTPSRFVPPPSFEYWFYAQVFYSIMAPVLGISINLLGVGMLALLGGMCVLRMGKYSTELLRPIALLLACGVSFVLVQVFAHGESMMGDTVREFTPWMISLFVIQYLARRRGFLHRFAIFALLLGMSTLPYMKSFANDPSRAGLDRAITIANPNDLGAWFGFCSVYFIILGLETRRNWIRAMSWSAAVGSLLVVGLTVSRAPLFAAAVSLVLTCRRVLKRGFFPFLALIVMAWVAYGLGWFDRSVAMYSQRGLEETGRLIVWPMAIQRFVLSPFVGVGISNIRTFIPQANVAVAPHNGFIYIALAAGVVPLLFFIVYWLRLFIETFRASSDPQSDGPFQTSLFIYSFLITLELNEAFMVPWIMVTLATVTGAGFFLRAKRVSAGRTDRSEALRRRGLPALAGRSRA